jgi:hypothetical protein
MRLEPKFLVLHSRVMQVETALFFETAEQIYARVFRQLKPRTPLPAIEVRFKRYANADSRISLFNGVLQIQISDMLETAPAPVQEALAIILICKLYRTQPDTRALAVYRSYLNRVDVRRTLHLVKQQRGRKKFLPAGGAFYDLCRIFDELNLVFFGGMLGKPRLGWSLRPSRTTLGHYDPSHNAIVLSSLLDRPDVPESAVKYVMYHEMLHLRHPTVHESARRCVHTREFKADEKLFPDFAGTKKLLQKFLDSKR